METTTLKTFLILLTVLGTTGLTACNNTGFSVSELGQKELDKLNPDNPVPSPTVSPLPTVTPTASPTVTPNTKAATETFNVPASGTSKVDMLFCVDNSGSMADKQQVLADSVSTFIDQFTVGGVDFHLGLVTSDVSSADANYWSSKLPGYVTPNIGRLLSRNSERFLMKSSTDVVGKFKANAKVGTSGSGDEQCFNSILYTLEDAMLGIGGYNESFMRDDALLSMIIVTDEDEQIKNGESVSGRIERMRNRISALKGPNSRGYSFDFVINKTQAAPSAEVTYPLPSGANYYPNFYLKAAEAYVSKTYDVLRNFGGDLAKIGSDIVNQAQSEFKLTNKAIASTIIVKLDGNAVAADAVDGYVYHADRNTIELKGASLRASAGAVLTIDYRY